MNDNAGRSCPIRYQYGAAKIAQRLPTQCDVLYVVGGLYGNAFALNTIENLAAQETGEVRICFNGDFNWFNKSPEDFAHINQRVLQHDCILGNVEAELGEPLDVADCGCAYPANVDQGVVDRSNFIHTELKRTAQQQPELLKQLLDKPFFARYTVGGLNVAVVHGDGDSLAGWRFDPVHLKRAEEAPWRVALFEKAQVNVFASSHTCSAAFHHEPLPNGQTGLISNNGAAGMPSATSLDQAGGLDGLITRISTTPLNNRSLVFQSTQLNGVWVEQVRVQFDQAAWQQYFLSQWPEGTAAHTSYFKRISEGI
ncbi:hypothetical protein [Limnobacter parvus]|uniref:Calcineurin-like phosphoesterase domain-containing protein n=1 Tax=Limnobacter parvus TaxID=2939690 RepID=A0ABT1XMT4_9BURK|nr:hypothetical protein [Limnobacter parvus]MCR2747858.1 hypothetical protein [Limnobacter parvus]